MAGGIRNAKQFVESRALAFGLMSDWFPPRIGAQDIDGSVCWSQRVQATVELNAKFFYLELKHVNGSLQRGQAIYWHRRIAKDRGDSVLFVCETLSTARTVAIKHIRSFYVVAWLDDEVIATTSLPGDLLEAWIKRWVDCATSDRTDFVDHLRVNCRRRFIEGEK